MVTEPVTVYFKAFSIRFFKTRLIKIRSEFYNRLRRDHIKYQLLLLGLLPKFLRHIFG